MDQIRYDPSSRIAPSNSGPLVAANATLNDNTNPQSISDANLTNKTNQINGTTTATNLVRPFQIETFNSIPVKQTQKFQILLANQIKPSDLIVNISNQHLGPLDKSIDWLDNNNGNHFNHDTNHQQSGGNKCLVSFVAPVVGIYYVQVEILNQPQYAAQFQAKAYDLSKVLINDSSKKCIINESYQFSVDASEAGEGQLEIAVNEGEIPNQVQVLDNGKCIVNFVPEDCVPHVVDIKFNGHNVNGCPFIVEVYPKASNLQDSTRQKSQTQQVLKSVEQPILIKEERILVDNTATFRFDNIKSNLFVKNDLLIYDPEGQHIDYKLAQDNDSLRISFIPEVVGDYTVELKQNSDMAKKLPREICEQIPFSLKVFDHRKVIVSDVTDGVIGHPIYFFIDASQAGSGNLEIRVSSKTKNVPNYPQSEANAKIRVHFTPTEAVDHSIDIKFNGIQVPGNPFLVKVAQSPQAVLPITSQDILKYVPIEEPIYFQVDYVGPSENIATLNDLSCQVHVLGPDKTYGKINAIKYRAPDKNEKQARFQITFKANKIGPYKFYITVNNELLPSSPILSNAYNINEVRVIFENDTNKNSTSSSKSPKPFGYLNKPITFTVDASKAGEGFLALAVIAGLSKTPLQTDVKVSDKSHGLYNLTFVPSEFAPHSIDMSFNDRLVPNSPFVVDVLDAGGKSSIDESKLQHRPSDVQNGYGAQDHESNIVQNFEAMSLSKRTLGKQKGASSSKQNFIPTTTHKKSLAFGLVNASNIVYLESGVLEKNKGQVKVLGPNNEKVAFSLGKGSPQPGEAKKHYIEYKPLVIGTHTINVLDEKGDLHQYFLEICDPSLIEIVGIDRGNSFESGKPVTFHIDSRNSGEVQLDSISITGPRRSNGKIRDGEQTILSRIKSISSSSSSQHNTTDAPLEYSLVKLSDFEQEVRFIPQTPGKYSIDIRCLGQPVGQSPYEIEVKEFDQFEKRQESTNDNNQTLRRMQTSQQQNPIDEVTLLESIDVHGISLKRSSVNATGAFIIETNRTAQARDFDIIITDPSNNLVTVQCFLQEDGNLLAKWTPRRVGSHKIEVVYKGQHVPGSPFMSETFDPSGVIIENLKTSNFLINDKIELKILRKDAGYGELDVAITSPLGQDLTIDSKPLDENDDIGEIISFTPTVPGRYEVTITFGGLEVPRSPLSFTVADNKELVKVSGVGLRCAEVNRSAQFVVESASDGELKLRIESGGREIVPKVERRGKMHTITYKPTEAGYANVSLYWNGGHVGGSPYAVPVNDLSKILFLSGTNKASTTNNQRMIEYEPRKPKEITIDTTKCGPGQLKAEAYCRANPSIKFNIPVDQFMTNRYKLIFLCPPAAEQLPKGLSARDLPLEATYLIRFYYNNMFIPETLASVIVSPVQICQPRESALSRSKKSTLAAEGSSGSQTETNNNLKPYSGTDLRAKSNGIDCPVVALRGYGLVDAKCGEKAEFTIDGSEAGPGKPEVKFSGSDEDVRIQIEQIGEKIYKATYIAELPGIYLLNVLWDGKQVAGCPISVKIIGQCDPSKVLCTGDGLKGGTLGEEIKTFIDTRRAGPGELTAVCAGRNKVAFCELVDRGDGTFILYIKPQEPGRHTLTIKYGGHNIAKSPFPIKVSGKPDPTKVRVHGPGVEHGVLSLYQSRFVCDTRGAGAGQLTVRIRGPKGAFRMETQRESERNRRILCKYDPTEPGDYRIEIKWSGHHVPGSPFLVMIFDTQEELNRFLLSGHPSAHPHYSALAF